MARILLAQLLKDCCLSDHLAEASERGNDLVGQNGRSLSEHVASDELVSGLLDDEGHIDGVTQIRSADDKAVVLHDHGARRPWQPRQRHRLVQPVPGMMNGTRGISPMNAASVEIGRNGRPARPKIVAFGAWEWITAPTVRVVAVHRAVQHTLARRCIRGIADRVSLEIDAHQHICAKRPFEGRIGCDPQLVFARDAHTHVAARRSDESVRVHFLDGANDLVANITDEDSTRVGDRAAWSGRSKRLGRRRIVL